MIELHNVTKSYKDTGMDALKDVSLKIDEGEFVFLIGSTGAGKSTLIKLLLREEIATSGSVVIDGVNLSLMRKKNVPKLRRGIGVVFQNFRLLPDSTVFENVAFAMQVLGNKKKRINHIVPQVLSLVGLEHKADSKPYQLSGGEQQRVSMARALVNNPPLLIADEPTGNLDPETSKDIMLLLERINRLGTTVIVATHAKELVDKMKKRVIVLDSGKIISDTQRGGYSIG